MVLSQDPEILENSLLEGPKTRYSTQSEKWLARLENLPFWQQFFIVWALEGLEMHGFSGLEGLSVALLYCLSLGRPQGVIWVITISVAL